MANLTIFRADYQPITIVVTLAGAAMSLVGLQAAKFQVKNELADDDTLAVLTKTLGAGITVTDARNGKMKIELEAADTQNIPASLLYYTLKVTDALGKPRTVANGRLDLISTAIKEM